MRHSAKMSKKNISPEIQEDANSGTSKSRLRRYFLAGIVVTAPISITIYLTYVFLNFIDNKVAGFLPEEWYSALYGGTTFPGIGLLIALVFFTLVGWLTTNYFGRLFIKISEYFVDRMPVIRTIYGATKQIFETIMASQSTAFREVVLLEYPRKGIWTLGFVTGVAKGEVQDVTEDDVINVFVPTTPNPTSGFLLFVPKSDLQYLDMSVEDGIKMVISTGLITPPHKTDEIT